MIFIYKLPPLSYQTFPCIITICVPRNIDIRSDSVSKPQQISRVECGGLQGIARASACWYTSGSGCRVQGVGCSTWPVRMRNAETWSIPCCLTGILCGYQPSCVCPICTQIGQLFTFAAIGYLFFVLLRFVLLACDFVVIVYSAPERCLIYTPHIHPPTKFAHTDRSRGVEIYWVRIPVFA